MDELDEFPLALGTSLVLIPAELLLAWLLCRGPGSFAAIFLGMTAVSPFILWVFMDFSLLFRIDALASRMQARFLGARLGMRGLLEMRTRIRNRLGFLRHP